MSEKRKRIFKESAFFVPFLLVVTIVSLILMFSAGRTVRDAMNLVSENLTSDVNMDVSAYAVNENKKYTLTYCYGEGEESTEYAEFSQKMKSDQTVYTLTLYEPRDGFDAGYYTTDWFYSEEFVTYAPLDDEENATSYSVSEQPYMYDYILSYSYDTLMNNYGATTEMSKGYNIIGLKIYMWDTIDRVNYLWGLGGNPMQFYSYLYGNDSEYTKVIID